MRNAKVTMNSIKLEANSPRKEPKAAFPAALELLLFRISPIKAPIKKGDRIAELVIKSQDLPETRHNLLAANSVSAGGFFVQIRTAGEYLFSWLFTNPKESL